MKVFISWSGERSRQVAELLSSWLTKVIQRCKPFVSTQDIQSGSVWFLEIGTQLADSSIGVICLAADNLNNPWILFEAGALTKGLTTNRVIPFLIELVPQDLRAPLSQLNATKATIEGLFLLVRTINNQLGDERLADQLLQSVFDTFWPQFEKRYTEILQNTSSTEPVAKRESSEVLEEILLTVRGLDKRVRSLENGKSSLASNFTHSKPTTGNIIPDVLYFQSELRRAVEEHYLVHGQVASANQVIDILRSTNINIPLMSTGELTNYAQIAIDQFKGRNNIDF